MPTRDVRPADVIQTKRDGKPNSREELEAFIGGYVAGTVPDYQVAAWLMAVCWRGMEERETADLTQVMASSGDMLDLRSLPHTVDKHSTGGVGDKTSLVLAPLLAAAGGTVAKMSGRGLGHTGGTVDKLESIPGFRSSLPDDAFLQQAQRVGIVISGQSKDLAPADGLLYALRDTTATVASLPLIASSIMSKKLAGGAQAIVLDVKVGAGAFMKTEADARELASTMIAIGEHADRSVAALLSSMEQPLGYAVGNALEVREAIACLQGEGPADLLELCLALAQKVLAASALPHDLDALRALIDGGDAYERFERWIWAQGGDLSSPDALGLAPDTVAVRAPRDGVVAALDALAIGKAAGRLGGGRSRKGDAIDGGVGLLLRAKVGDPVSNGEEVATLYHRGGRGLAEAEELVTGALKVEDEGAAPPLLLDLLD